MSHVPTPDDKPLWRDEFSVYAQDERYVGRRQFAKFLGLASLGMLAGQVWILAKSWLARPAPYPALLVARVSDVPVDGVKMFRYPTPDDPCILIRPDANTFVAYSQKCTHLSCAVYYAAAHRRIECPCHVGHFSVESGRVLQGPPPRPLPRIELRRDGDALFAVGVDLQAGEH
jgi:Rieske Fe-S protein